MKPPCMPRVSQSAGSAHSGMARRMLPPVRQVKYRRNMRRRVDAFFSDAHQSTVGKNCWQPYKCGLLALCTLQAIVAMEIVARETEENAPTSLHFERNDANVAQSRPIDNIDQCPVGSGYLKSAFRASINALTPIAQ